jgi:regulator of RNase E activity RraA
MDVAPGEIIHMDENGACKFPANKLAQVLENVKKLRDEEGDRMGQLQQAKSAAEVRTIFGGHSYAKDEKK